MNPAGFHISIAGGIYEAPPRAAQKGCDALQLFSSPPSRWARPQISKGDAQKFIESAGASGIRAWYVHAIYLLNLASDNDELRGKSIKCLATELQRAEAIGSRGVIFHQGSAGTGSMEQAKRRVSESLKEARKLSGSRLPLILENSAGAGALVGASLDDIESIIGMAPAAEPMKFCLDTAHAFASGYALHTGKGLDEVMSSALVRGRLEVVHANDSMVPFGSRKDRHWHIGEGEIGLDAFRRIVNHPAISGIPLIMETPGDDADDARNMKTMRALLEPGICS